MIRVDNTKTAIAQGSGHWGVVNERYATDARTLRFHVDATRPREPQERGKVERRILARKKGFDPRHGPWRDLAELQSETDLTVDRSVRRRVCPITGTSVWEAHTTERSCLQLLPFVLSEPFDLVAQRRVAIDSTISFEGRSYSVPFRYADQIVDVRGCAGSIQVWAEGEVVASHPRHTRSRLVLNPAHYDGPSTNRVLAPTPPGRMGRKVQELWALTPERRSIAQYAALAEVAR